MRTSTGVAAAVGLAAALGAGVSQAEAGIAFQLRFADGTTSKPAATGSYAVNLFAQVSGIDVDHTNDSFQWVYGNLASSTIGGGAAVGEVATVTLVQPFNQGLRGVATNISSDNFFDWGQSPTDPTNPPAASSQLLWERSILHNFGGANQGDPTGQAQTFGSAVNATTWEWNIGRFELWVGSVTHTPGASTRVAWTAPSWPASQAGNPVYAVYFSDLPLPTKNTNGQPIDNTGYSAGFDSDGIMLSSVGSGTGGIFGRVPNNVSTSAPYGSYVEFTTPAVPEPASLGMLAIGAAGLLMRRRRRAWGGGRPVTRQLKPGAWRNS